MNFSSKLIEDAVKAFSSLPGIGKKTALRLVLHLLQEKEEVTASFVQAIGVFRADIKQCRVCGNISDADLCTICLDKARDHSTICVVENIRDLMAIESTGLYKGAFHVLGGVISPIDGVGPEQLNIDALAKRLNHGTIKEVIMAISPTIEGETTIYYLSKLLESKVPVITQIARGVSFGGELEYADELTLARSIADRVPYSVHTPSAG